MAGSGRRCNFAVAPHQFLFVRAMVRGWFENDRRSKDGGVESVEDIQTESVTRPTRLTSGSGVGSGQTWMPCIYLDNEAVTHGEPSNRWISACQDILSQSACTVVQQVCNWAWVSRGSIG
jgi:hypothetical protein